MILQEAKDTASTLEPPQMFTQSLLSMEQFSYKHSGAKSNNLKFLKDKLDSNIKLPESACVPFQMAEYSIDLEPDVKKKLQSLAQRMRNIKSVKKMNKMLYQCKDLVLGLKFHDNDPHQKFMKQQLINFGIQANQWEQAWKSIKKVWASKYNERAFLAVKKLGVHVD